MIESQEKGNQFKLSWDNLNRLVQSERNGHMTEYGYDVFGRRLYKANKAQNTLTLFGWDGDLMIWESHQSGQSKIDSYTKHYVYEPNSFVPLLQGGYSQFINLLETPNYEMYKTHAYSINKDPLWKHDARKAKSQLEQMAFYHCDQVGTPQTLSNEQGECVWTIELNTWGKEQRFESKNKHQILEQTNFRFQGQYYDEETGLHYNRYRYYEPHSGRYISKDPIGLFGGLNNTSYVSDPNQWVDPMGLNGNSNKTSNKHVWTNSFDREENKRLERVMAMDRKNKEKRTIAKVSSYLSGQKEIADTLKNIDTKKQWKSGRMRKDDYYTPEQKEKI